MSKEKKTTAVDTPEYEKKTKIKFFIFMAVCMLIGGVIGFFCTILFKNTPDKIIVFVKELFAKSYIFQIYVCPVIILTIGMISSVMISKLMKKAKVQIESWDGEDEEHIDFADKTLTKALVVISTQMIITCILFAIMTYDLFHSITTKLSSIIMLVAIIIYLICIFIPIVQQNKLVALVKKYAPEKKGSTYDKKFSDIWYESCDEAERQLIHEAAYKSYASMNKVFSIFLTVTTVIGMFVPIGILCSVIIGILWFLQTYTYQKECRKLEHKK